MKSYKKYILITVGLMTASLQGCSLLDEELYTTYTKEELYETEAGIAGILAGAWMPLTKQNCYGQFYTAVVHGMSGAYIYNQAGTWAPLSGWQMNAGFDQLYKYWTSAYSVISQCNDLIYYIEDSPVAEDIRNPYRGEAYLLRAMMYFDLVRLFGGVPLRLEPTNENNIYCPRATAAEVYAQIISDLTQAESLMCEKGAQRTGHPHRLAATALKAKVYMVMAGNRPSAVNSVDAAVTEEMLAERYQDPDKNADTPTNFWFLAYDSAKKVYGEYALVPDFTDLWDVNQQNSTESIIEIQNSSATPNATASIAWVWMNKNNADYAPKAGTYLAALRPRRNQWRYFEEGDPRRDITCIINVKRTLQSDGTVKEESLFPTAGAAAKDQYPIVKKYVDPDVSAVGNGNENIFYLRYAEILLILAETVNEIENSPANAYAYVNEVLTRARCSTTDGSIVTYPKNWGATSDGETIAVTTVQQFRNAILEERFRELMGEFNEFSDFRRRGTAKFCELLSYQNEDYMAGTNDVYFEVDNSTWVKRYMLMPIPLQELNENIEISIVEQNFGY